MKLVSANIKDNPDLTSRQQDHDVAVLHGIFGLGATIIGWQEIGEPADHESIRKHFPEKQWLHLFPELPVPLTIKKSGFKVLDSGFEMTHHGLEHVSPNRYFTWVKVKKTRRPRVKPFVVINTHFVSGAWTAKEKVDKPWRREHWHIHAEKLGKQIGEFLAEGLDVYVLGDFNRIELPMLHAGQHELVNHKLDHILYFAAGKRRNRRRDGGIYGGFLYTDHSPVFTKVTLLGGR